MKLGTGSILLLVLSWVLPAVSNADPYMEISTGLVFVQTPADTVYPPLLDLRIGIEQPGRQFELALMSSLNDDRLNELSVETPAIVSLLYHHIPQTRSSLKVHLIVGASWVDIESQYPVIGKRTDRFSGLSFGIGFEEHFPSNPRLKLSLDLMQLYLGDDLDVYSTTLGVHYEF